jgi:Na+/melibiose symporter-like transporter
MAVDKSQYIPVYEKVGYSMADAAANFVFMSMILFQAAFYTDVMHIEAGTAALIILVPRLWDAFFDPIMGITADRTKTRWGRFRPWILWTAIPWGIVLYLAYTVPALQGGALVAYAVLTNALLMTLYSANNMPYSALGGVMSGDIQERAKLNSFRFIAVNAAQFIVQGFTLVWVSKFAGPAREGMPKGDVAHGWSMVFTIYAVMCVVFFLITFSTTKERVKPVAGMNSSIKQDFRDLLKNSPWVVMFIMTMVHFGILAFRGGAEYQYYQLYASKQAMFEFIKPLGLTAKLPMFDNTAVDEAGNSLNLHGAYGLTTGQKVKYQHGFDKDAAAAKAEAAGGAQPAEFKKLDIGGLVDGNTYYINVQNDERIRLYDSRDNAKSGGTEGLVHLTATSTGNQHEIVPSSVLETLGYVVHADPSNVGTSNVANAVYGLAGMIGKLMTILVIVFSPPLAKRFGKKAICVTGFALMIFNSIGFYLLDKTDIGWMIALTITGSLCYAPTVPLVWAIFADVADYSEWKTGRRATGTVFATIGFALKAGLAIGAYGLLQIQHIMHYDPNAITPAIVQMFRVCTTIVPSILFAICTVLLITYKLNKKLTIQIADELAEKRKAAEAPAVA